MCVCRLLFQQKRLTWSSCNQTTLASGVKPRTSTSHPVGSEGLDDVQEVFSRAQPVSQVFQPCTERLGTAMRRRCNASSKLEQMSNSRTRPPIARGPWRLQRVWDAYPSAFPPWPLEKRVAAAGFTHNTQNHEKQPNASLSQFVNAQVALHSLHLALEQPQKKSLQAALERRSFFSTQVGS